MTINQVELIHQPRPTAPQTAQFNEAAKCFTDTTPSARPLLTGAKLNILLNEKAALPDNGDSELFKLWHFTNQQVGASLFSLALHRTLDRDFYGTIQKDKWCITLGIDSGCPAGISIYPVVKQTLMTFMQQHPNRRLALVWRAKQNAPMDDLRIKGTSRIDDIFHEMLVDKAGNNTFNVTLSPDPRAATPVLPERAYANFVKYLVDTGSRPWIRIMDVIKIV